MRKVFILSLSLFLSSNLSAQQQTVGLFQNSVQAFDGYTLFAPMSDSVTYLIDNCGEKVHSWNSSYKPAASVYLLDNGTLLRTRSTSPANFNTGGSGGGIEMLDWDGNLIWEYGLSEDSSCQHHDIEPLPNGNILAIMWEAKSMGKTIKAGREAVGNVLWSEKIVEIKPDIKNGGGSIVWEWKVWDHLVQEYDNTKDNYGTVSSSPQLIDINFTSMSPFTKDWLHFNSIDYNPELDQIVISVYSFNEIWIIDHSTSTAEAATHTGGNQNKGGDLLYRWGNPEAYKQGTITDQKLFRQHDARWIDKSFVDGGKIMVFNNQVGSPIDYSEVNIINPPVDSLGNYALTGNSYGPTAFHWTYQADTASNFFSGIVSGADRLKNGNTLMCEGVPGRFTEVDLNGNKVWEYVNPVTNQGAVSQGTPPIQNIVFRCSRYPAYYPAFKDKSLSQQGYIETGSTFPCTLFPNSIELPQVSNELSLYPNPFTNNLRLNSKEQIEIVYIYSSLGQLIYSESGNGNELTLDLSQLENGIYYLNIKTMRGVNSSKRIIKN